MDTMHSCFLSQKLFRTTMLFHFINVLLLVLVRRSHDLLQEEIVLAVYNMASVDFDSFYSTFLPQFLGSCQGIDANQRSVLGCSFKMERVRCPLFSVTRKYKDSNMTLLLLHLVWGRGYKAPYTVGSRIIGTLIKNWEKRLHTQWIQKVFTPLFHI